MNSAGNQTFLSIKKISSWFIWRCQFIFVILLCGCSDIAIMNITSGSVHSVAPPVYNQFRQFVLGADFDHQLLYTILPLDNNSPEREYLIASYHLNGELQSQRSFSGNIPFIPFLRYFSSETSSLGFIATTNNTQGVHILNLQTLKDETVFDNRGYPGFTFLRIYPVDQDSFLIHARHASSKQDRIIYYNFRNKKVISEFSTASSGYEVLAISHTSESVVVAENFGDQLLRYDLPTGELLQKILLPSGMKSYHIETPQEAFSPDGNSFLVSLLDTDGQNVIYLVNSNANPVSYRKIFSVKSNDGFICPFGFYDASKVFLMIQENEIYSLMLYDITNDRIEQRITLPTNGSDCFIVQNGLCIFYD